MSEGITGKKRKWVPVMAIALAVVLSYTIFSLVSHSGIDNLTVSEFMLQADSFSNKQVRVEGKIAPGSIDWDDNSKTMQFVLTDGGENLSVVYKGIVSDNFKPGGDLVVEGKYGSDAVFQASKFGSGRSFCSFCH